MQLSPDEKYLLFYIFTSPHTNMVGFFHLPKLYACHDLGWDPERFDKGFAKLLEKGFINYDETTSVILIPNFLKYNPIQNTNQSKGAVKALQEMPDNSLFPLFFQCLKRYAEPFMEPFREAFPERYGKSEYSNQYTETEDNDDDNNARTRGAKIVPTLEQEFGRTVSPSEVEKLVSYMDDGMSEEVICDAIKRATVQGVRKVSYVESILRNWLSEGVQTMQDIARLDQEFEEHKKLKEGKARGPTSRKAGSDNAEREKTQSYDRSKFLWQGTG